MPSLIEDVPTKKEFLRSSSDLLNTAWRLAIDLLIERKELEFNSYVVDLDEYQESIQPLLRTALTLVQQATEFHLKAGICEVSPFLLIAGMSVRNWPTQQKNGKTSFTEFQTLDAKDLVKAFNTVKNDKLSDEFTTWYGKLREKRNEVVHSVSDKLYLWEVDILRLVLEMSHLLHGARIWPIIRQIAGPKIEDVLSRSVGVSSSESNSFVFSQIQREFVVAVNELNPAETKKHFGFDKKKRRYLCETCIEVREMDEFFELVDIEEHYNSTVILDDDGEYLCLLCGERAKIRSLVEDD